MPVYITGTGNISVQPTATTEGFPEFMTHQTRYARCIEPSWAEFIAPMEARRMSSIIKRAIASTQMALTQSGIKIPDAIITGTGLGCIEDTEKFLTSMIAENERFLKPTYFIHSTHNTISSQIAIRLSCNGYNNTFVHRGISFELALHDAMLMFMEGKIGSAIVGGHDEMTPAYFSLLDRVGYWKKEAANTMSLSHSTTPGSVAGEGSISFMLSDKKTASSMAEIKAVDTFYNGSGTVNLTRRIETFLSENGLRPSDIDLLMMGLNGDVNDNNIYFSVADTLFGNKLTGWYKHMSLEYFSSPAFGMWVSALSLQKKQLPDDFILRGTSKGDLKNILLYNHFRNRNHSLILLTSC